MVNPLNKILSALKSYTSGSLKTGQTAKTAGLHNTYGSHLSRSLTPASLRSILQSAAAGDLTRQAALFADMLEQDGHLQAELGKRQRAITKLGWSIELPEDASAAEKDRAQKLTDGLKTIGISDVIEDMTTAIGEGFSCIEMTWHRPNGEWWPQTLDPRPIDWFTFTQDQPRTPRYRDNSADGQALQQYTWITHQHPAKPGSLGRMALMRILAWSFLFKYYSSQDLAEMLEILGVPIRLGKYPNGTSDKDKQRLLKALISIGHDAAGIVQEGMEIEFIQAAKGTAEPHMTMIQWCERVQSRVITGATLTTQGDTGKGTNALGNNYAEVEWDLTCADATKIEQTINRDLLGPILQLNGWQSTDPHRQPRFSLKTHRTRDIAAQSEGLNKLVSTGVQIPQDWANHEFGIPLPKEGEAVLTLQGPSVSLPTAANSALQGHAQTCPECATAGAKAAANAMLKAGSQQDLPGHYADQLADAAGPHTDAMVAQLRAFVDETLANGGDMATLRDGLIDRYGDLDTDQLAEVMAEGFAAAHLGGRYEAGQDE